MRDTGSADSSPSALVTVAAVLPVPARSAAALEHPTDPQRQLARAERLDHVVVGAVLQADHPVGLLAERGQHDHRHGRGPAQLPAHLESVHPGQHQIEHEQVGLVGAHQLQAGGPVGGLEHFVPVAGQVATQHLAHGVVVVDDQHAFPADRPILAAASRSRPAAATAVMHP